MSGPVADRNRPVRNCPQPGTSSRFRLSQPPPLFRTHFGPRPGLEPPDTPLNSKRPQGTPFRVSYGPHPVQFLLTRAASRQSAESSRGSAESRAVKQRVGRGAAFDGRVSAGAKFWPLRAVLRCRVLRGSLSAQTAQAEEWLPIPYPCAEHSLFSARWQRSIHSGWLRRLKTLGSQQGYGMGSDLDSNLAGSGLTRHGGHSPTWAPTLRRVRRGRRRRPVRRLLAQSPHGHARRHNGRHAARPVPRWREAPAHLASSRRSVGRTLSRQRPRQRSAHTPAWGRQRHGISARSC